MQHKIYKKVVLIILDGFGVASYSRGNAIALADPGGLNHLVSQFPAMTLQASGPLVGLPWGEMGNSEVGHLNIGAGRIVGQDLPRINRSIERGDFFKNPAFLEAIEHVKKQNSSLHLLGLVSNGGVHSSDEHLYALLGLASERGLQKVYIHMFTDGRDTGEKVALNALQKLRDKIAQIGVGKIATVTGRFYAMDRGRHWDQTELTFQAIVNGVGAFASSAEECILSNYDQNIYDEMTPPTVIAEKVPNSSEKKPIATIRDNDAAIFFNFRSDRALQLTKAFVEPAAMDIQSKHASFKNLFFVTMTQYFVGLPVHVAFPIQNLANNLSEVLSQHGFSQFHIAESEKYAHVTSFFSGGRNEVWPKEERLIVNSPSNTKNYVDHPEMSADKLTDFLLEKVLKTETNFFVANFANPDMVGHTGNLHAGIKAVQFIDKCLEKITQACLSVDAAVLITADHGNIEQMLSVKTGQIDKDHSTSPVPLIFIINEFKFKIPKDRKFLSLSGRVPEGVLSDIAPTILDLFGLKKPEEMTGINLLNELVL